MKNYDIIIFDLDGTLSDSKEGITKSAQYALEKIGIPVEDPDVLEYFIGPPLKDTFAQYHNLSEEKAQQAVGLYRERYNPIGIYECSIYPGTKKALQSLKNAGKFLAVATSKPQQMAERVLEFLGIAEYFDAVMGAELKGARQSKQAVLTALFEENALTDKARCVMVGDTCFDIDGAKAVGIDAIGVTFGFGDTKEMTAHGAIAMVDSMEALTALLLDKGEEDK